MMQTTPKNPFKDTSFYAALLPLAIAFAPHDLRVWVTANPESVAPLGIWLATHGWLRHGNQKVVGKNYRAVPHTNPPAGDPDYPKMLP